MNKINQYINMKMIPIICLSFLLLGCDGGLSSLANGVNRILTELRNNHLLSSRFLSEHGQSLRKERVHLVDNVNGVLLFRSNVPINLPAGTRDQTQGVFAYNDLINFMRQNSAEQNVAFPQNPVLVDISLLNNIIEAPTLDIERSFFSNNPSLGRFINQPVYGALLSPNDVPNVISNEVARLEDVDDLQTRISNLRSMMENASPNTVFVIHCMSGEDRTGEYIGAYSLRYLNMTFDEYIALDTSQVGRAPVRPSQNGVRWYERRLGLTK